MEQSLSGYTSRVGESTSRQFIRSGRFFQTQGNWYFKTREGINYGPYTNKTECRYAYNEFIDVVSATNDLSSMPIDFDPPNDNGNWEVPKINFN